MYLSIIESIYLIYMFILFKTQYSIHHPYEHTLTGFNSFIKHPIKTRKYENKICMLGKVSAFLLSLWILLRKYIDIPCKDMMNKLFIWSFLLVSLLMNLNAFLYFIPIAYIELVYNNDK